MTEAVIYTDYINKKHSYIHRSGCLWKCWTTVSCGWCGGAGCGTCEKDQVAIKAGYESWW